MPAFLTSSHLSYPIQLEVGKAGMPPLFLYESSDLPNRSMLSVDSDFVYTAVAHNLRRQARLLNEPGTENITQLLIDLTNGNRTAVDDLLPLIYGELRSLAANYLRRERPEHTLQPTALVHEAYLR